MKNFYKILILPLCIILFSCAGETDSSRYETSATGRVNSASMGVVLSVRNITIATTDGTVGSVGGAVAGGAAGSMIGGSSAVSVIGAVGGAILGGAVGSKAQEKLSEQNGLEYIIKLDNGRVITITQGTDNSLRAGDRCIVLDARGRERARVIRY